MEHKEYLYIKNNKVYGFLLIEVKGPLGVG